jgi:DNA-binding beta-propeller fold protein YncE
LVADSGASKSVLIDPNTYKRIKDLPLEIGANCTLYDTEKNRVYITTGGDRVKRAISTLVSVDPNSGLVLKSTTLPSIHLQPLALDASTDRLFVNLADKNIVAVVDRNSFRLLAQWSTGPAKTNSAIAFDGIHHRLFVVGEPGVLAVLNSDTGKITDTISVPAEADDLAFDAARRRLYVPGGDGFLGIYDASVPDHVKEIARIATRKDARTAMLISQEHKYLLAAPAIDGKPAAILVYDTN